MVRGEPARILLELERGDLVLSNTDALVQGLLALREKILRRDFATARLQALEKATVRKLGEER